MLRGLSKLTRVSKWTCSPFNAMTAEDSCRVLMGRRGSNVAAFGEYWTSLEPGTGKENTGVVGELNKIREYFHIYKRLSQNKLYMDLEDLPVNKQSEFVDLHIDELKTEVKQQDLNVLNFNYLNEEAFRYHLNMPMKKLGFSSRFVRYNHDLGLAIFEKLR